MPRERDIERWGTTFWIMVRRERQMCPSKRRRDKKPWREIVNRLWTKEDKEDTAHHWFHSRRQVPKNQSSFGQTFFLIFHKFFLFDQILIRIMNFPSTLDHYSFIIFLFPRSCPKLVNNFHSCCTTTKKKIGSYEGSCGRHFFFSKSCLHQTLNLLSSILLYGGVWCLDHA